MFPSFFRRAKQTLRRRALKIAGQSPVDGYFEYSVIHPIQNGASAPNDFLVNLALDTAREAQSIKLPELTARVRPPAQDFTPTWPGEHYRFLAALVKVLQPKRIIEIGTFQGLSALAFKKFLPPGGIITTFDVVPWRDVPTTCLVENDFADGRLRQELGDLADLIVFRHHEGLLHEADLLFIDAPKDGIFERKFLENLQEIQLPKRVVLIFDDIRVWNMLDIWHEISRPKLDVTSFGHWSGTGLVDWHPDAVRS